MELRKSKFGLSGVIIGAIALMIAVTNFWAGPFAPQPSIETTIAEKVSSIRQKTVDAIKGKKVDRTYIKQKWNIDKAINVAIPAISVIAIFLGILSFIKKEPSRIAGSATVLGFSAIAFQFIAMYLMALLVVLLIAAVVSNVDIGIG